MAVAKHTLSQIGIKRIEERENRVISRALKILEGRLRNPGIMMSDPLAVGEWLRLQLAHLEHEEFWALFLDNRHRLIAFEPMFRGSINATHIHPREIIKRALALNAAAVIVAHNHPSQCADPSHLDILLTERIRESLALVDIRLLDHFIVGGSVALSLEALNHLANKRQEKSKAKPKMARRKASA